MSTSDKVTGAPHALARRGSGRLDRRSISERLPAIWVTIALAATVVALAAATNGRFVNGTNVSNILLDSAQLVILAVPMTFVISTAGIDLSVGTTLIISSVVGARVMGHFAGTSAQVAMFEFPHAGRGILLGIVAAVVTGFGAGSINGYLIAYRGLPPFVVTLATMGAYGGLADVITDGKNIISIPPQFQSDFGTSQLFGAVPYPVLLALVVAGVGWFILRFTVWGTRTLAIGSNAEASRRVGVDVKRHMFMIYACAGMCAGIAGLIDLARFTSTSIEGHTTDNLSAIAAVVLGGTSLFGGLGNISGTVVGSILPGVLNNGLIGIHVQPFWQPVILGVALLIVISYDTHGRRKG